MKPLLSLFFLLLCLICSSSIVAQELLMELEDSPSINFPANYSYQDGLEITSRFEIDESTEILKGYGERGNFIGLAINGIIQQQLYYNEGYDGYLIDWRVWRLGESFDYMIVASFGEEDGTHGLQLFYLRELQRLEHWQEILMTAYQSEDEGFERIPEASDYFMGSVLDRVRLVMHNEKSFSISLRSGWYQIFAGDYPHWIDDRITLAFSRGNWELLYPRLESGR